MERVPSATEIRFRNHESNKPRIMAHGSYVFLTPEQQEALALVPGDIVTVTGIGAKTKKNGSSDFVVISASSPYVLNGFQSDTEVTVRRRAADSIIYSLPLNQRIAENPNHWQRMRYIQKKIEEDEAWQFVNPNHGYLHVPAWLAKLLEVNVQPGNKTAIVRRHVMSLKPEITPMPMIVNGGNYLGVTPEAASALEIAPTARSISLKTIDRVLSLLKQS